MVTAKRILFIAICYLAINSIDQWQTTSAHRLQAQNLEVQEKIGLFLPRPQIWLTENDQEIDLYEIIANEDKKPTILIPAYFTCDRLCPFILRDLALALDRIDDIDPGKNYQLIAVSINPRETRANTQKLKQSSLNYLKNKNVLPEDWYFLRGNNKETIDRLMEALGYPFRQDGDEFYHSAVIFFINGQYQINRYIYGSQYDPADIRLSLIEASELKLGKSIDKLRLYCFRYDPVSGKYTALVKNMIQLGAGASLVFVLLTMIFASLFRRKKHR